MCGRYTLRADAQEIARHFAVEEMPGVTPRYNVAPSQAVAIIRVAEGGGREADMYRWGLIPSWAKDPGIGNKLINARSETVAEKPAFRDAYKRRRCLVIADGYFEWQKLPARGRQPYYFKLKDDQPFAFAGLYEHWRGPDDRVLNSCTLLTTQANDILRPVHDRMPVMLHRADYDLWLDTDVRQMELLHELFRPYAAEEMTSYRVSALVNRPTIDHAELINSQ